jgi:hypothetical protein
VINSGFIFGWAYIRGGGRNEVSVSTCGGGGGIFGGGLYLGGAYIRRFTVYDKSGRRGLLTH